MAGNYSRFDLWFNNLVAATILWFVSILLFVSLEKILFDDLSYLSIVVATITTVACTLWLLSATKIHRGPNRIVLNRGDDYSDIGVGPVSLGVAKWTRRVLEYSPKLRTVEKDIRLQTKDGTFVTATLAYTWKPDPDNLADFFSEDQVERIDTLVKVVLQLWAKQFSPQEIFSQSPPSITDAIAGLICGGPMLSNFVPDGGSDMSKHIRDNSHLIQSIVNEVEDENRIEAIRETLKDTYRDSHQRIDNLCNQRKAELRRRSLRA